jgi:hypothetical protein
MCCAWQPCFAPRSIPASTEDVDGAPVSRYEERLPSVGVRYRIVLSGNSAGTTLIVGPMSAWTDVRQDVDWQLLERAAADTATAKP